MPNVYIDLGCYDGDTIQQFRNWKNLRYTKDFEIYGFDPNPKFSKTWEKLQTEKNSITFSPKAAWIKDEVREFAVDKSDVAYGSTLMPEKIELWESAEIRDVACFDFSNWLTQFKERAVVIVKMDIEGAEFEVLNKMIQDRTDSIISHLFIEWHGHKLSSHKYDQHTLEKSLRCKWSYWS